MAQSKNQKMAQNMSKPTPNNTNKRMSNSTNKRMPSSTTQKLHLPKPHDLSELNPIPREIMQARKASLEKIIQEAEHSLEDAPEASLRIHKKKNVVQYYYRTDPKDTNGTYIHKKDIELAKKIAQKDYDLKILSLAKNELALANRYEQLLQENSIESAYDALSDSRQALITPVLIPIDEYVDIWLKEPYDKMGFDERYNNYFSNRGVQLRSKSEVIIANCLEQYNIPYKYERPIELKGLGTVHPDFTCLNKSTRKEFIWEHFGMMDNENYASKNIVKLSSYTQSGYFAGKNMILTFETSFCPLNTQNIKMMIKQYLL